MGQKQSQKKADNNEQTNAPAKTTPQPKPVPRNPMSNADAKRLFLENVPDFPSMHQSRIKIGRPYTFKAVITIGGFNYDQGAYVDGIFVGDTFYRDACSASQTVLSALPGWANEAKRCDLCQRFMKDVLCGFRLTMNESVAEVNRTMPRFGSEYHRPTSEMDSSSKAITVTAWVRWKEKGDKDPDNTYRRIQHTVTPSGAFGPAKILSTKTVPIRRRSLVEKEGL